MFQIITKRDNLIQARGFKTKKDAINYLYCSYMEDSTSNPYINFRDPALGNLARFYDLYKIIKIDDSTPINQQV